MFIDECESIFVKRGSMSSDSFTDDIVQAFIAEWDGFDKQQTVLVLGATNRRDIMDEAVLSRFAEQIEIPLPDAAMRQSIFAAELAALTWQGELPENSGDYLQGFSGREIANLARQMVRNGDDINEASLAAATRDKRTGNNSAVDKDATWDKLVLNDANKKSAAFRLRRFCQCRCPARQRHQHSARHTPLWSARHRQNKNCAHDGE